MRNFIVMLALSILFFACEKVVDIKEIAPTEVVFCNLNSDVEGSWVSDSVHVVSVIDTVDSITEDKAPTLTYFLDVKCAAETSFRLSYVTFAGVETEDVRSTNFEEANGRFYVYNQLDSLQDTSSAPFVLDYVFDSNERITATMVQNPNAFQQTTYTLFLRRAL
jgi:hypothetical protein